MECSGLFLLNYPSGYTYPGSFPVFPQLHQNVADQPTPVNVLLLCNTITNPASSWLPGNNLHFQVLGGSDWEL